METSDIHFTVCSSWLAAIVEINPTTTFLAKMKTDMFIGGFIYICFNLLIIVFILIPCRLLALHDGVDVPQPANNLMLFQGLEQLDVRSSINKRLSTNGQNEPHCSNFHLFIIAKARLSPFLEHCIAISFEWKWFPRRHHHHHHHHNHLNDYLGGGAGIGFSSRAALSFSAALIKRSISSSSSASTSWIKNFTDLFILLFGGENLRERQVI